MKYNIFILLLQGLFLFCTTSAEAKGIFQFEELVNEQKKVYAENFNLLSSSFKNDYKSYITKENINNHFQKHNSILPFVYNDRVKELIEFYLNNHSDFIYTIFVNNSFQIEEYGKIFKKYHMPEELKLLPIVISGNNPFFRYDENKKGIWQLNYFTAKLNGLNIDTLTDERLDPASSAYAAAKYIFTLYNEFRDMRAAVYAFSSGAATVKTALKESDGSSLNLYNYLPEPENDFFNALSALYFIEINFNEIFSAYDDFVDFPNDTLEIDYNLKYESVSEFTDLDTVDIKKLNPKYYKGIVPGKSRMAGIIIPSRTKDDFLQMKDSIYAYNDSLIKNEIPDKQNNKSSSEPNKNLTEVYYKVKPGDTPGFISEWFDVGLSQLVRWNNIRNNIIRAGETLVVYVPSHKADYYRQYNQLSYAEKQRREGYAVNTSPQSSEYTKLKEGEYIVYTVRKGDNPWLIAKQFPGVSDKDILRWNNINPRDIRPGQKLKIKKQ